MIGVYVHIPYCRSLCPYCDFVRAATPHNAPEAFLDALSDEIVSFAGPNHAGSVYFGGGTPSLLTAEALERMLTAVHKRFTLIPPKEVTIEANPDDVTPELTRIWEELDINRVSLGVQSFDDSVLRYLGRRHDACGARQACGLVAERFENWSMDLIFGAHPIDAWEGTLRECLRFAPKHVSAYSLAYEPGTPFAAKADEAVDEDTSLELYRQACIVLGGLDHYEISNFARPGYQCAHNLVYWRNEEYAGFGPGAYSFVGGIRARNTPDIEAYIAEPGAKSEELELDEREVCVETLIQHFRLAAGLEKSAYLRRFGRPVRADFGPQIDRLLARKLLVEDAESIRPSPLGFELNNEIGLTLVG